MVAADRLDISASIVGVDEELTWRRAPFIHRARKLCGANELPEWKIEATARTLETIFHRAIHDGLSVEDALAAISGEKL